MTTPNSNDRTESGEAAVWYVIEIFRPDLHKRVPMHVNDAAKQAELVCGLTSDILKPAVIPVVPLSRAERAEAECAAMRRTIESRLEAVETILARGQSYEDRPGVKCRYSNREWGGLEHEAEVLDQLLKMNSGTAGAARLERAKRLEEALRRIADCKNWTNATLRDGTWR